MTTFGSGEGTEPQEIVSPNEGYPTFMFAPTKDYQEMNRRMFNFSPDQQNLNNFLNAAIIVHASVSFVQSDAVSPDCNIYAFAKSQDGAIPEYKNYEVDTKVFYERFPTQEELDKQMKSY